jgi:hypothetical protein
MASLIRLSRRFVSTSTNKCRLPENQSLYQTIVHESTKYPSSQWEHSYFQNTAKLICNADVDLSKRNLQSYSWLFNVFLKDTFKQLRQDITNTR